ncbi:MAG: ATP-binding cassette domain-containing protein [Clostridia bacterium]|nr:ATP-binding cassette domain-containing protein [Clostridia bacterium]
MLQLKEITKVYGTAGGEVRALDGVDLSFRKSEFVSILGPSGCGKTTLLNVIGGLDQYTSGDLIIGGRSTKEFRDADWDSYRNHSVGFVFQSYNLIPHQTVLANVELALTLSGVSKAERRERAAAALKRVGLGDQLNKKPNQMSGGQMQRVAIARALVNDPEILLADEPTGALDSATSVQIMEILKEISRDRLVIMVTHNPELAEQYSSRIIRLLDGRITGDTNPCTVEELKAQAATHVLSKKEQKKKKDPKTKRTSMSFFTALGLSLNNLMTKKARSFLTSFAGSIGIIGIALILSVSNGVQLYINSVQQETLSSYPITLQAEELDMSSMMISLMGASSSSEEGERDPNKIYSNIVMYELMNTFISADTKKNNLGAFAKYMEEHPEVFDDHTAAKQFLYNTKFDVYTQGKSKKPVKVDASEVFNSVLGDVSSSSMMTSYSSMMSSAAAMNIWQELIPGKTNASGERDAVSPMLKDQYELLSGKWPEAKDEIVLIVNSRNELSDMTLYALDLQDRSELSDIMAAIMAQQTYDAVVQDWSFNEILSIPLSLSVPTDYYVENENVADGEKRQWIKLDTPAESLKLKITGIIKPAEGTTSTAISGSLGYTYHLTDYMIDRVMNSEIVQYQLEEGNENYDVLTGKPFALSEEEKNDEQKKAEFDAYLSRLTDKEKYDLLVAIVSVMPEEQLKATVDDQMKELTTRAQMEEFIKNMMKQTGAEISSDLLNSYIERLDDAALTDLIRTSLESATKEFYRMQAVAGLEAQLDAITPMELATYKQGVLGMLGTPPDRMAKIGYLLENYELLTALPKEAYTAYLMGRTDAEIDKHLDDLLTIQGNAYLSAQVKDEAYRATKAAGILGGMLAMQPDEAAYANLYDLHMPKDTAKTTYEDNLAAFGMVDKDSPSSIVIYVETFEYKEVITDAIADYNKSVSEEDKINYTDYVALLMSSVTTIINAISYVLIAFVAISLIVSSIMIGIITYISVLERTKEIGILRAIGASKGDISRVFNAETLSIGFVSGLIGIVVTLLLIVVINIILYALTGIPNLQATLPWAGALILIGISMLLTFIAGLIPSRIAAKKDPVVALRSE